MPWWGIALIVWACILLFVVGVFVGGYVRTRMRARRRARFP